MTTQITTHSQDAIKRLIQQYRESITVHGLITPFVDQIQDLENALFPFFTAYGIDTAVGEQLNNLGEIVGEPRNGLSDDAYRIQIKAKIIKNIYEGEPNTMILIFQSLTGANVVILNELYPAAFAISADGVTPGLDPDEIRENVQGVAPAGVRLEYVAYTEEELAFSFDGLIPGGGFGDFNDPLQGGAFVGIV